jgi:3',5'-cyclic AMP phosphodiesterase CpdA
MFVIAHVSDTHFGNQVQDPTRRATTVMEHLLAMDPRPDVLVVTGDVADHGLPQEYDEARAWLARWGGPSVVCPGNHDAREAFRAGLGIEPSGAHQVGGFRFLMLDSLIDAVGGQRIDEGRVPDQQLTWLDEELASEARPSFVCLHHPPSTLGLGLMDPIRLVNGDALAVVIQRHDHVAGTLVGHAHTMSTTTYAGHPLLIGGGVVSTVTTDAEHVPTLWYDAAPSFALHLVDDDLRIISHWRALAA